VVGGEENGGAEDWLPAMAWTSPDGHSDRGSTSCTGWPGSEWAFRSQFELPNPRMGRFASSLTFSVTAPTRKFLNSRWPLDTTDVDQATG